MWRHLNVIHPDIQIDLILSILEGAARRPQTTNNASTNVLIFGPSLTQRLLSNKYCEVVFVENKEHPRTKWFAYDLCNLIFANGPTSSIC